MLTTSKSAPYLLKVALCGAAAPQGYQAARCGYRPGLLHLVQACLLAELLHGTSQAVRATAYRVGCKMSEGHRQTAALIINSRDSAKLILDFELIYTE